jgi:hypothetical protein
MKWPPSLNLGQTLMLRLRHYSIEVQGEDKARVVFFLGGDITFEKKMYRSEISIYFLYE